MKEIKFSDFKIIADVDSVHKECIDDETYFGEKYKSMISNSRLKWINPVENGSPDKFKNPPHLKTDSLSLGSVVHQCTLEKDKFYLLPKIGKPGAKLGKVFDEIDSIVTHTEKGKLGSLDDIIKNAALKVDYYSKSIDKKLEDIKQAYITYIHNLEKNLDRDNGKTPLVLSDNDWDIATACINSLQNDTYVQNLLFPVDELLEPRKDVYCEDAMFMDFIIIYKDKHCVTLPFKMKIDNWNIDYDNKIVTLNDLKTTGKSVNKFMLDDGSWYHYHYYRQLGAYTKVLKYFVNKEFGISENTGWRFKSNICAIETIPNYWSRIFNISDAELNRGLDEFYELLKRVAACEIFGYEEQLNFTN